VALSLAFGFADDVGRALRRHGDWFLGERNGAVARGSRSALVALAGVLEKWDPPPELAPIVLPPNPTSVPYGPWPAGEKPPEPQPTTVAWFHPLAGPRRALPRSESRRFGAARPQPRPPECELGHCGVDLGSTVGEPVFAVFDGVIEKIERDETRDARSGRFIRIGHKDATVVSRYNHLDSIRDDLKEGDTVAGGTLIGRLGATGIANSGPHLHFALSIRPGGRGQGERYVDPEPLLRNWQLPMLDAAPDRRLTWNR
jgi:murein DD-endopeptidase MepM/ murein hydrolase activator NlpD